MERALSIRGSTLIELLFIIVFITCLSSAALITSAEINSLASINSQAKIIQNLISNSIFSAYRQNRKQTLSISKFRINVFRNNDLIDQHILKNGIFLSKVNQQITLPWIEDIYPTGSQSPFTLQINNKKHICLITASLRGRVSRKCI